MGNDPVVVDWGHLLDLVLLSIVEDCSSSRAENGDDGIWLFPEGGSNQIFLIGLPDGKDASDGKVGVHNRAAIKWIEGHDVSFPFSNLGVFWSFLTSKGLH